MVFNKHWRFARSIILLCGVLATPLAQALSIGSATAHSYLTQPLDAEIALHGATDAVIENTRVQVGDPDDFEKLGIAWNELPVQIHLALEQKNGRWFVHATSRRPVAQPYVQFPLRIRSGKLLMLKEITLLLDPPGRRVSRPSTTQRSETPRQPAPRHKATVAGRTYRVKSGDTLWPIAQSLRPRDVSNYQMMIALQQENPEAFAGGNINNLKAGSLLTVPSPKQVRQIDARDARRNFFRQQDTWKTGETGSSAPPARATAPRQPPAPAPAAADKAPPTEQPAASKARAPESAPVEAKLEVLPPPDKLPPETSPAPVQEEVIQRDILLNEEQVRSNEVEQANFRQQIANLQAQMEQIQTLLKLKDQQIAALQSIVDAQKASARQAAAPEAPATASPPTNVNAGTVSAPAVAMAPPSPAPTTLVTIASNTPTPAHNTTQVIPLPVNWLWAIAGGVLVLLLLLLFRRRGNTAPNRGDLPLGAYPEVADSGPKPYAERVRTPPTRQAPAAPHPAAVAAAPDASRKQDNVTEQHIDIDRVPEQTDEDIDLPLGDTGELPELDEQLLGGHDDRDKASDDSVDQVADFWEHLDIPDLQDPEENPAAIEEEDQSLEILLEMARAYVELGDRDEAINILNQALASADTEEKRERINGVLHEIG